MRKFLEQMASLLCLVLIDSQYASSWPCGPDPEALQRALTSLRRNMSPTVGEVKRFCMCVAIVCMGVDLKLVGFEFDPFAFNQSNCQTVGFNMSFVLFRWLSMPITLSQHARTSHARSPRSPFRGRRPRFPSSRLEMVLTNPKEAKRLYWPTMPESDADDA